MYDLQLQHFEGPGLDIKKFIDVKKVGRFTQITHARDRMNDLLSDAESKGYIVCGSCYCNEAGTESFALQIIRQGVPLYEDN